MPNMGTIWRWRWVNDVPLRGGDDATMVNWCELTITYQDSGDVLPQQLGH